MVVLLLLFSCFATIFTCLSVFSLIILIMKILFYIETNFKFDKKAFLMQLFYVLLSLKFWQLRKNNTGYFVNLNISLAFSSNVAATLFVTWLEFSIEFNKIFNIALKKFVLISNKVTLIVTWESLERFTVHVQLHCMQCLFIKGEIGKFLKVVYTVDKNSRLK